MISVAQIRAVCERHESAKCLVSAIPQIKLTNARSSMRINAGEQVIALLDMTLFGSAKSGMAVCESGLYWKNDFENPEYVPWQELQSLTYQANKSMFKPDITFSDGRQFYGLSEYKMVDGLLADLYSLLNGPGVASVVAVGAEWMLAVNQQQHGPYDTQTILELVAAGQVDPTVTLVWREGMHGWLPFSKVQELNVRARPAVPAPPPEKVSVPPPPPPQSPVGQLGVSELDFTESEAPVLAAQVDINNASLDDLLNLPGLTLASAKRLMDERQTRLGFATIEEVGVVLNLRPHTVQRLRERVVLKRFIGSGPVTSARGRVVDF